MPASEQAPPPYHLAMIICDWIHRDPGTGKPTLLGCFSVIHARAFPAVHPFLAVYAQLTDGRGKVPVTLRLIDADEEREPIYEQVLEVEFTDPRAVVDLQFVMAGLTFPEAGEYRFQLSAGAEPLLERRLLLVQIPEATQ